MMPSKPCECQDFPASAGVVGIYSMSFVVIIHSRRCRQRISARVPGVHILGAHIPGNDNTECTHIGFTCHMHTCRLYIYRVQINTVHTYRVCTYWVHTYWVCTYRVCTYRVGHSTTSMQSLGLSVDVPCYWCLQHTGWATAQHPCSHSAYQLMYRVTGVCKCCNCMRNKTIISATPFYLFLLCILYTCCFFS